MTGNTASDAVPQVSVRVDEDLAAYDGLSPRLKRFIQTTPFAVKAGSFPRAVEIMGEDELLRRLHQSEMKMATRAYLDAGYSRTDVVDLAAWACRADRNRTALKPETDNA